MLLTDKGGGDFEPVPEGVYPARCFQIIDIGTQHWTSAFGAKTGRKIMLGFELVEEKRQFKEGEEPQPMIISGEYLASLNEKANLRKLLESWRGKKFTDDELAGFDPKVLIGVQCLVNVTHNAKGSKTYANIAAITPIPKGMKVKNGELAPLYFSLDEFSIDAFRKLPEWMQKKIAQSDEFKAMHGNGGGENMDQRHPADLEEDSEIPF